MLRSAWFIAKHDLTYMLRQRETLLWVFVMPVVFFFFIGNITGGFGVTGDADEPDPLALIAPPDGGFLLDELSRRLREQSFAVERPATDEQRAEFRRELVVPQAPAGHASVTDAVLAGVPVELIFRRRGEGLGADYDQVRVARAVYTVLADLVVHAADGESASAASFARLAAAPRNLRLEVVPAGARQHIPHGFEQTVPGTMVMFTMLVLLTSGAILLVIEREEGLLRRLASAPVPRGAVVLGKWVGKMALGLVQLGFAMLAGSVLFGMNWGTALPMVAVVLVAWAAFNASLGIALAGLARSQGQMAGIGVVATLLLAALGGCWWPIEVTPAWMQKLQLALPTGWAMDAMHRLVSFGHGAASAAPHALALALAALLLGVVATRTFRYS